MPVLLGLKNHPWQVGVDVWIGPQNVRQTAFQTLATLLASIVIAGVVFKRLLTLSYLVILSVPEARVIWSYLHLERRTLHLRQAARAIGHAT